MSQKYLYITFLAIVALGVLFYIGVKQGLYPIAIIDGHWITAKQFEGEYNATQSYFAPMVARERAKNVEINDQDLDREYRRASLDRLVEITLVRNKAVDLFGSALAAERAKVIEKANIDVAAVETSIKVAYGWDYPLFAKLVIVPQAERDLVTQSLEKEKTSYEQWLSAARADANVYILISGLAWDGKNVIGE